jgi:2-oxoglutarate dehydrogenase E2 component (dihydrolipoamide succinyltransferase)
MATKVIMPQLGESVVEGTVSRWLVKEGQTVQEYDPILEVSTDKLETDIPSPATGTVLKILVKENETVNAGTILAWIGQMEEDIPDDTAPIEDPSTADTVGVQVGGLGREISSSKKDIGFISPVVAKMAQEHHLDLSKVKGTGSKGRITKQDVLDFLAAQPSSSTETAAWETPGEGDLFRPTEMMLLQGTKQADDEQKKLPAPPTPRPGMLIPHTRMRRIIADHMIRSIHTSAHVTTVMEADLSLMVKDRERLKTEFAQQGVKLTYTAYFMLAAIQALIQYPEVNSSWQEDGLLLHPQINLGVAVSLGKDGLIVPVIHQAENYSLMGLARVLVQLADRARNKQLTPEDVQGGTFSITNHGVGKSLFATPVINQPQCGILGIGTIQKRAVVIDDAIAIRPMVYLSFTFDHRVLDGTTADGFLAAVIDNLQHWR